MTNPLYCTMARTLQAYKTCVERGNTEWEANHLERLERAQQHLPSGSGLDLGPRLDMDKSTPERLVFERCSFHHMDEWGSYDGWSDHEVVVTPSLAYGCEIRVTGRDRNCIKEYIHSCFAYAMDVLVDSEGNLAKKPEVVNG